MNREVQFERIKYLISFGIKRDAEAMDRVLEDLFDGCDSVGDLYAICYFLGVYGGKALRELLGKEDDPEGFVALEPAQLEGKDAPEIFALRFIIACANDDRATALALFETAYAASDEEMGLSISALAVHVSNLAGATLQKKADPGSVTTKSITKEW